MTDQEFEKRVNDIVEARMRGVRVERVDKCSFEGCHTPATHFSTFDGSELCAGHADSYIVKMRAFFEAQARKYVFRAKQYEELEALKAEEQLKEEENDEGRNVQGETGASAPNEGDRGEGGIQPIRDAEVPASVGSTPFDA